MESALDVISFKLDDETVEAQFYLMEAVGRDKPQEKRKTQWLPLDAAIAAATHDESKRLLGQAAAALGIIQSPLSQ